MRPTKIPRPLEVAGIRVKVGSGLFCLGDTSDGLDAPILEVVDRGDSQQITAQIP